MFLSSFARKAITPPRVLSCECLPRHSKDHSGGFALYGVRL